MQEINLAKSNGSGTLVPHSPGETKAPLPVFYSLYFTKGFFRTSIIQLQKST